MRQKRLIAVLVMVLIAVSASLAAAQVEVHGFLLARTIATPQNYAARIDRYGFQFAQKVDDEFNWLVETYIHPTLQGSLGALAGRVYLESAYLDWHLKERLPWDLTVRIGKGRNYTYGIAPTYGNRHTSDYSLYSEVFTQVRVLGFQTFSNFGNFQIGASLLNPNILGTRQFPDFTLDNSTFVPVNLAFRDNDTGSVLRSAAFSGRLGYKASILNVGGSVYVSKYGPDAIGGIEQENSVSRFGLDGEIKMENGLLLQGQFSVAQSPVDLNGDGIRETALDHSGFEVLGGYEKGQYGLMARYGQVDYDDQFQALNQVMLSAVYKIRPTIHFRLEGLINGEQNDQGFTEVDNNVLFFETLFAW